MGGFKSSVVSCVGFLACLIQYVCPQLVFPAYQTYNMPTSISSLQFGAAPGFPVSGKTYVAGSATNYAQPQVTIAQSLSGMRANPFTVSTSGQAASFLRRPNNYITRSAYTSIPSALTYTLARRNYTPFISRQQITRSARQPFGQVGRIFTVAKPNVINQRIALTRRVSGPAFRTRPMTSAMTTRIIRNPLTGGRASTSRSTNSRVIPSGIPTHRQSRTRSSITRSSPRGQSLTGPSIMGRSSSGRSRTSSSKTGRGLSLTGPFLTPPPSLISRTSSGIHVPTRISTGRTSTSVKKSKKKSKSKSRRSRKSKSNKSKKSKAQRKAELKAKLNALKAKKALG